RRNDRHSTGMRPRARVARPAGARGTRLDLAATRCGGGHDAAAGTLNQAGPTKPRTRSVRAMDGAPAAALDGFMAFRGRGFVGPAWLAPLSARLEDRAQPVFRLLDPLQLRVLEPVEIRHAHGPVPIERFHDQLDGLFLDLRDDDGVSEALRPV